MKANKFKGNARNGARKQTYTVQLKSAANYCGEKTTKTIITERILNKRHLRTLADMVYENFPV